MYPHERSLVEKLKDRPFALLGVNSDAPDKLPAIIRKNKLTWRSWADGPDGPIARQYQIRYWPTIFVLDHTGVIRYKDVRGTDLDNAVTELLNGMK